MANHSILIWFFLLPLIVGCGGKSDSVVWSHARDAISLEIVADESLNLYAGEPHTLALCVHQLSDPDKFGELSGTPSGVLALLKCDSFDASVSGYRRIVAQPGEQKILLLDRAENARFIGISAGYYNVNPAQATRLFEIPIDEHKQGYIPFFRDTVRQPGRLKIDLLLDPQEIQDVGGD
ncbi:MAG: type VI secretion system lipoprotein TssJ [Desulfocurvibacter africanus]